MTKKKPEPNPIEEAIGERAKDPKALEKFTKEYQTEPIPLNDSHPSEVADEPTPTEMLDLEELNRQTEERLRDDPEFDLPGTIATPKSPIPVSKSDLPPETKSCTQESPPQGIDDTSKRAFEITKNVKKPILQTLQEVRSGVSIEPLIEDDEIPAACKVVLDDMNAALTPAEDIELVALRKYLFEDGFVVATVAFHIVTLCAQPMVTPSTTTWDFADRALIPEMVFALLKQPGYLEGIWPSLKVVMGSNKGNAAWCSGIAITIAFFDIIRTLPTLKEMENGDEKKS